MGHHHAYSVQRRARAQSVTHQSLALPSFRANSVDSVDQANRLVYAASFRHVDYESDRSHVQGQPGANNCEDIRLLIDGHHLKSVTYLGEAGSDAVAFRMWRVLQAQGHCRTLSVGALYPDLPARPIV
jgi:hypothetical protein